MVLFSRGRMQGGTGGLSFPRSPSSSDCAVMESFSKYRKRPSGSDLQMHKPIHHAMRTVASLHITPSY